MKRTTSQRELPPHAAAEAANQLQIPPPYEAADGREDGRLPSPPSPPSLLRRRILKRRFSSDHSASHFLKTCGLCNLNLGPGLDTFMYRGEFAYCSVECREKQMMEDEKKERKKCSLSSMKKADPPPSSRRCESSPSSETVGAA